MTIESTLKERGATGTEARVCQDIAARQAKGVTKYGTTVAENPLGMVQWLQHAYEEALDQAIYLKRAIEQLEGVPIADKAKEHLNLPVVEMTKSGKFKNTLVQWHGGSMPAELRGRLVWVRFSSGHVAQGWAERFAWEHFGGPADIVAYRVIE